MEITRNQHELKFRFDKKEWSISDGKAVRDFLAELKDLIAPDHRNFDSSTNTWTIEASFGHVVEDLKRKYFTDPNQAELF